MLFSLFASFAPLSAATVSPSALCGRWTNICGLDNFRGPLSPWKKSLSLQITRFEFPPFLISFRV